MTLSPLPPASHDPSTGPSPPALLLWCGIQIGALALAAGGVRLWAHHPDPSESLAVDELLVAQMLGAALLFPTLFRDGATTLACLAVLLPFDALAGVLSPYSARGLCAAAGWVALWCVGLATWRPLVSKQTQPAWLAASLSIAAMPPLIAYAATEAGRPATLAGTAWDGISGVIAILHGNSPACGTWAVLPLAVGGIGLSLWKTAKRAVPAPHFAPPTVPPHPCTRD